MRLIFGYLTIFIINSRSVLSVRNQAVSAAFQNSLPDVLEEPPKDLLNVYYPTAEVSLGDEIAQTQTIYPPIFEYDSNQVINYTMIMIDPDVPSAQAPALRNYLMLLQVNIPGGVIALTGGTKIAAYIAPTPYPGSGSHRYTFLLYEQTRVINVEQLERLRLAVKRYRFDVEYFAECNGLVLVAGNFFTSKVPALKDEYYCKSCKNYKKATINKYLLNND